MSKLSNSDILRRMREIQYGCELHRKYRPERAPRAKCKRCNELWKFQREIRESAKG
jgi:hypothetical protein